MTTWTDNVGFIAGKLLVPVLSRRVFAVAVTVAVAACGLRLLTMHLFFFTTSLARTAREVEVSTTSSYEKPNSDGHTGFSTYFFLFLFIFFPLALVPATKDTGTWEELLPHSYFIYLGDYDMITRESKDATWPRQ